MNKLRIKIGGKNSIAAIYLDDGTEIEVDKGRVSITAKNICHHNLMTSKKKTYTLFSDNNGIMTLDEDTKQVKAIRDTFNRFYGYTFANEVYALIDLFNDCPNDQVIYGYNGDGICVCAHTGMHYWFSKDLCDNYDAERMLIGNDTMIPVKGHYWIKPSKGAIAYFKSLDFTRDIAGMHREKGYQIDVITSDQLKYFGLYNKSGVDIGLKTFDEYVHVDEHITDVMWEYYLTMLALTVYEKPKTRYPFLESGLTIPSDIIVKVLNMRAPFISDKEYTNDELVEFNARKLAV